MAIELHDAVNLDGLFDVVGKGFHAIATLNTAQTTTVPDEVEDFYQTYAAIGAKITIEKNAAMGNLSATLDDWQENGLGLANQIVQNCQDFIIQTVADDADQPNDSITTALEYVIAQMVTDGDYVDESVAGLSLATGGSNLGDVAIAYTDLDRQGYELGYILAEALALEVTSGGTSPTIRFRGIASTTELAHDWPQGSGITKSITAVAASGTLVPTGDFQTTTIANVPDDWVIQVGDPGTSIEVSAAEIQTVVIAGSPEAGHYVLQWTDTVGTTRSTSPLAWNASGSAVRTALRLIPGLSAVTVAATGTSPNYTHTITFTGTAGDISQLTSVSHLTGGTPTITHATTQPGAAGAFKGRALMLRSDGSTELQLYAPLTVSSETVYICHFRMKRVADTEQSSDSSADSSSSSSSSSSNSSSTSSSVAFSSSSSSNSSSSSSESSSINSSSSNSLSSSSSDAGSSSSSTSNSSSSSTSQSSSSVAFSSSSSSVAFSSSSSVAFSSSSSSSSVAVSSSSSSSSASYSSSSSSQVYSEELRIEIVSEIGGSVTQDTAGNDNELVIDLGATSTITHDSHFFSFRLPRGTISPVYLRIWMTSPITTGHVLYIDEIAAVAATQLYTGGPYVAAFSGVVDAVTKDAWTLTATNNRAGLLTEWMDRAFSLAAKAIRLPTSGAGSLIPDSVVG